MANVTWSDPIKPNGAVVSYVVRYKEVPGDLALQREVAGGKQWTVIDKLTPAGIYEFSVAATTKAGTGKFKATRFDFTWCKYLLVVEYS